VLTGSGESDMVMGPSPGSNCAHGAVGWAHRAAQTSAMPLPASCRTTRARSRSTPTPAATASCRQRPASPQHARASCKRVWVTIVLDELLQGVVIDDKVPAVLRDPANVATKFHHEKTDGSPLARALGGARNSELRTFPTWMQMEILARSKKNFSTSWCSRWEPCPPPIPRTSVFFLSRPFFQFPPGRCLC